MVRLSIINAWAELQVSTLKQPYLIQVVSPNLPLLCPLWVSSLRDYAGLQVEEWIEMEGIGGNGTGKGNGGGGICVGKGLGQGEVFDSMYGGLTREVILPVSKSSDITPYGELLKECLFFGLPVRLDQLIRIILS